MGRGKGQIKMVKKSIGGSNATELSTVFNQLLGDEKSLDPVVIMEKYIKLISNIKTIKSILNKFVENILVPKFSNNRNVLLHIEDIKLFINKCDDLLVFEADISNVINIYKTIKDDELISIILLTCKKLLVHVKSIENIDNLSEIFIHNEPGITLELFSFSKLNFKTIFNSPLVAEDNKKYILIVLSMIFSKSYDIYNLVTSPDIDIDKFSKIIIDSIQEAKKVIPRCDKAFRKIAQSVDLLKNNFNNYYKDFIETQSPTIIIENFILDSSKDLDSDPETTRQFKKIVMYYQKRFNESGKNKDPKLKQMFETIHEKFKILETKQDEEDGEEDGEEDCEEDDGYVKDVVDE